MPLFMPAVVGIALTAIGLIANRLRGKRFAVLGPHASGKTTFIQFLRTGEVTLDCDATEQPTKLRGRKVKLKEFELRVADFTDLPGDKDFQSAWKKEVEAAHVVCYLFDAKRFIEGDGRYVDLVTSEMRHVNEWRKEAAKKRSALQFFLIGTHLDQVAAYRDADPTGKAGYVSAMWKVSSFERLGRIAGGSHARCLGGSLSDKASCEHLASRVIGAVAAEQ